jgi:hypothetical protein
MLGEFVDERELTTRACKAATGCEKEIPRVSGGRGPLGSRPHNPPPSFVRAEAVMGRGMRKVSRARNEAVNPEWLEPFLYFPFYFELLFFLNSNLIF